MATDDAPVLVIEDDEILHELRAGGRRSDTTGLVGSPAAEAHAR